MANYWSGAKRVRRRLNGTGYERSVTAGTMDATNDDLTRSAPGSSAPTSCCIACSPRWRKTPSTHAIFVDAGYVYAAAGRLVAGTEDRRSFDLDAEGLIEALIDKARTIFADSRLLRVYWYDGARRRIHTPEQQSIAELPDVKVRLGNLNANNQQKGVDSLIRTDLESLARHRAISDAALVGGDEDLVSAVEAAQGYGARVHLWGIEAPDGRNQAEPLLWEVDSQRTFDLDFCQAVRRPADRPPTYEHER